MLIAEKGSRQQQSSFRLPVKHVWMNGRMDGGEKKVAKSRKMLSSCQSEINERGAFSTGRNGLEFLTSPLTSIERRVRPAQAVVASLLARIGRVVEWPSLTLAEFSPGPLLTPRCFPRSTDFSWLLPPKTFRAFRRKSSL